MSFVALMAFWASSVLFLKFSLNNFYFKMLHINTDECIIPIKYTCFPDMIWGCCKIENICYFLGFVVYEAFKKLPQINPFQVIFLYVSGNNVIYCMVYIEPIDEKSNL